MAEQDTSRDDGLARVAECYRLAEEQVGTAKTKGTISTWRGAGARWPMKSAKATFQPIGHSRRRPPNQILGAAL